MQADQDMSRLSIRTATQADREAVERLALLEGARPVGGETLVAEVDGEIRAALPLSLGRVIADPFEWTAHLGDLLVLRARQLEDAADGARAGRRLLVQIVPALGRHA